MLVLAVLAIIALIVALVWLYTPPKCPDGSKPLMSRQYGWHCVITVEKLK